MVYFARVFNLLILWFSFNFHTMISSNMCYVCVAKEAFGVRIPFGFLDDIRMLFVNKYGSKGLTAMAYAMNDEFSRVLTQKMDFYSNDTSADKVRAINAQIELVKSQMLENLGSRQTFVCAFLALTMSCFLRESHRAWRSH